MVNPKGREMADSPHSSNFNQFSTHDQPGAVVIDPSAQPTPNPYVAGVMSGPVPFSSQCRGCGYDLSGLDIAGLCPECSKPIFDSLQGDLLAFAPRHYLQSLHRGTVSILASILFYVMGSVVGVIAGIASAIGAGTGGGTTTRVGSALAMQTSIAAFGLGVSVVYTIMSVAGWYWFTQRDPGVSMRDKADKHRRIVRFTAVANGVCGIGGAIFGVLGIGYSQSLFVQGANTPGGQGFSPSMLILVVLSVILAVGVFVLWAVQIIASLNYMAWLASRVPDMKMRETALKYRWILPLIFILGYICAGLGPVVALILYYNLLNNCRIVVRNIRDQRGYGTDLFKPEAATVA